MATEGNISAAWAIGRICSRVLALLVVLTISIHPGVSQENNNLDAFVGDGTAEVRFFYQPYSGDYFHPPLVIQSVPTGDLRLDSAPMLKYGRTAFVTATEVEMLVARLSELHLKWQVKSEPSEFELPTELMPTGKMRITILSSKGTADSSVPPDEICSFMKRLDSTLTTPRALWELRLFRFNLHCKVRRFNPQQYPDHNMK